MILHNYIFKQVFITTLNITVILFSMIWLIQSLRQIDLVIENGSSFFDFLYISILPSPLWLMMILPISSLLAVIIVFNRFYNDKEILVFHFSGVSFFRIIKPILIMSFINLIFLTIINLYVIPKAYNKFKSKQFELRNNISQVFLRAGIFNDIQKGLTILIDKRISKFDLEGIFIYDTRVENKEIDTFAKKGRVVLTPSGPIFQLIEGHRREVKTDGQVLNELSFKNYTMDISRKKINPNFRWLDVNEKSIFTLLKEENLNSKSEAHFRLAFPILVITLPLQAIIILLCFSNINKNQIIQISSSLLIALLIQVLLISMRRVLIFNPSLWFVFYLIPILPIVFSLLVALIYNNKIAFFQFKKNQYEPL